MQGCDSSLLNVQQRLRLIPIMSMNTLTEEPEDMETMDETARLLRSVSETDTEGLRDHKGEAWTEDVWGGTVLQK